MAVSMDARAVLRGRQISSHPANRDTTLQGALHAPASQLIHTVQAVQADHEKEPDLALDQMDADSNVQQTAQCYSHSYRLVQRSTPTLGLAPTLTLDTCLDSWP